MKDSGISTITSRLDLWYYSELNSDTRLLLVVNRQLHVLTIVDHEHIGFAQSARCPLLHFSQLLLLGGPAD